MQTALYKSWSAFVHSATQLDGQPFSDKTRAQLQSSGTGFLVFMQRKFGHAEQSADQIEPKLRRDLSTLSKDVVDEFLSEESGGKPAKEAQLRSVLKNLVRPWLTHEGLLLTDAFPTPEAIHPADVLAPNLSLTVSAERYFETVSTSGDLSPASAANMRRILHRFLRFAYDTQASGHGAEQEAPVLFADASEFEKFLRDRFDNLLDQFCRCTGPNPPQPSRSSAQSARSALSRHIRPLMLPDVPAPERPNRSDDRAKANPARKTAVKSPPESTSRTATEEVLANSRLEPSTENTAALKPSPPTAPPPSLQVTESDYAVVLENAVSLVSNLIKRPRSDVAKLGLNAVRVMPHEVRILPPPTSERAPSTWIHSKDATLREAIDRYGLLLRDAGGRRGKALFFVTFAGDSIAPPVIHASHKKKHSR
jgi:hypothetical protein